MKKKDPAFADMLSSSWPFSSYSLLMSVLLSTTYLSMQDNDDDKEKHVEDSSSLSPCSINSADYPRFLFPYSSILSFSVTLPNLWNIPTIRNIHTVSSSSSSSSSTTTTTTSTNTTSCDSNPKKNNKQQRMYPKSKPIRLLHQKYDVNWHAPLGEGSFGAVYEAILKRKKNTPNSKRQHFALKRISKKYTDSYSFQREIMALLWIQENGGHPNICGLYESYEDYKYYYLILDFISGGELFDHLIQLGAYSELDASRVFRDIASALNFLHGIGLVHGDLKPENLLLSTHRDDSVVQIVDFGCAQFLSLDPNPSFFSQENPALPHLPFSPNHTAPSETAMAGNTIAYSAPEALRCTISHAILPPVDIWSLGCILYIMLTGVHPFDITGNSTDEEIEQRIRSRQAPPLFYSPMTAHLSPSAIDVIDRCLQWNPQDRITALDLLQHPWVQGETAKKDPMENSDKKLSKFRIYKSKVEAQVFADFFSWSDQKKHDNTAFRRKGKRAWVHKSQKDEEEEGKEGEDEEEKIEEEDNERLIDADSKNDDSVSKKTSLIERAFQSFDSQNKGFLTNDDLKYLSIPSKSEIDHHNMENKSTELQEDTDDDDDKKSMSFSQFSDLLSENMKNRYFPRGYIIYHEGDIGNHMYFINSGTIELTTKDGSCARRSQGDFFGEGALLHPNKKRSATIKTVTPVHAIEIKREYFEKYLEASQLSRDLKEKDKTRKRNRAKTILRLQKNLREMHFKKGDYVFRPGDEADSLYILEKGRAECLVQDKRVFVVKPGDICGEHSLILGRPRNSAIVCVSDACVVQKMKAIDFYQLYNSMSLDTRTSLREICLRREFQKALVNKTMKDFPSVVDLRDVFDAADKKRKGYLTTDEVRDLLQSFDPSLSEEEMHDVFRSLDLDGSEKISFDEFRIIFGMNEARASSM